MGKHFLSTSLLALLSAICLPGMADAPDTAADLQLMVGAPPGKGQQVTAENALLPPFNRWSFQHMQSLFPTRSVVSSDNASQLDVAEADIGNITIRFPDGRETTSGQWLAEAYTDGFIALHDGKVVSERYLNGQRPSTRHIMFSVTKSLTSTLMLMLAEERRLDLTKPVSAYLPELTDTAYGDASVQQVMDMTNSIAYDETYDDPDSDIARYFAAISPGGEGLYSYLSSLGSKLPNYEHGEAFRYVTPSTEVLGWIIRRVSGQSLAQHLEEQIWVPMGSEYEANIMVDPMGIELAGAGMSMTLRDAARFGQMILLDGRANGGQVVPVSVAQRIKTTRNVAEFTRYYDDPWYGGIAEAYHDQWWSYRDADAVAALGIHGQFIYINMTHNVVIVKQSSDPYAEIERVDNETPIVMHAISKHLATLP